MEPSDIHFDEETHVLTVKLQKGPIKEVGPNGCQLDDVILWITQRIAFFNKSHPCHENELTVDALKIAHRAQHMRKLSREARGVEGTSKV